MPDPASSSAMSCKRLFRRTMSPVVVGRPLTKLLFCATSTTPPTLYCWISRPAREGGEGLRPQKATKKSWPTFSWGVIRAMISVTGSACALGAAAHPAGVPAGATHRNRSTVVSTPTIARVRLDGMCDKEISTTVLLAAG